MATFPAITGIAAYFIAGFTPHVISNNASFNCAFSSANVCACARACSKCISKYAHFARISRSISRLRARDAADASRFAARRFARLCGAPIVDVIGANTPQTRPRHHTRLGARARNESTSNARHVALDRALDGGNDTQRAFSSSPARGRPRSVVRARANDAETARAQPRRGADATRPIIVRETCHVACNNTSPPQGLYTYDIRTVCVIGAIMGSLLSYWNH